MELRYRGRCALSCLNINGVELKSRSSHILLKIFMAWTLARKVAFIVVLQTLIALSVGTKVILYYCT